MGIRISRCLKEELVLATDKQLQTVSNIMLFTTVVRKDTYMYKAIFKFKQFCSYGLLCGSKIMKYFK